MCLRLDDTLRERADPIAQTPGSKVKLSMTDKTTLLLIEHGNIYAPQPLGEQSILVVNDRIIQMGDLDRAAILAIFPKCEVVDASGCYVVPGLIDPHQHIIGAGGEKGFKSREPEISLHEIVSAGITTVIGLLGTDVTTRHIASLYAKASELTQAGITAFTHTGGYKVPPITMLGSVMDDIVMLDRVIGVGEIAIADFRSTEPSVRDLAQIISDAILGGLIGGKAGITHFHVGDGKGGLSILREVLDNHNIPPEYVYPTHINRNEDLIQEAIELAQRGCFVDMDTVDGELGKWVGMYRDQGGSLDKLTLSSDTRTPGGTPAKLYQQFVACIQKQGFSLEEMLPLVTSNTAAVLKLPGKGNLQEGNDADILILDNKSLDIRHVIAKGQIMISGGKWVADSPNGKKASQVEKLSKSQA
jgi:beta-aspartyl-dipeptidase (metallo-type)